MRILEFSISDYCARERDLCEQHTVRDDDELIETELEQIQSGFCTLYPHLAKDNDYEFPYWHNNLRLFWVYLYSDDFYERTFISHIQKLLSSQHRGWFAEFECYSPAHESPDSPTGYLGQFLIFNEAIMFCSEDNGMATLKSQFGL